MASEAPGERLREEARCPVCLDFLQDPVSVDCGHSFCLRCISEFCEKSDSTQGGLYACPQCRGPFGMDSFRPNRQLASLVDSVRQLGLGAGLAGVRHCPRHGEELSCFCEEDQVALCWICDTTPEHRSHHTKPLQEAARCYQVRAAASAPQGRGGGPWFGVRKCYFNRGAAEPEVLSALPRDRTKWCHLIWIALRPPPSAHIQVEVCLTLLRGNPLFRTPVQKPRLTHCFRLAPSPTKPSLVLNFMLVSFILMLMVWMLRLELWYGGLCCPIGSWFRCTFFTVN